MVNGINLTEEQRLSLVRKLWLLHPERGETAAVNFYDEMEQTTRGSSDEEQVAMTTNA